MELGPWEAVHGQWPAVIVQSLAAQLPDRFVAAPRVHLGVQAEIDIATFDRDPRSSDQPEPVTGGTAVWAPSEPSLVSETELADFDEYEVQIFDTRYGRKLVAAIEIISPANKDRPESRRQFTAKCASLIRQGVCVALVDLVTSHRFNLYSELLNWINQADAKLTEPPPATYATSCRWHPNGNRHVLEAWNHPLEVRDSLPTLPIWLTPDTAIPLDLEASYEQTCKDLRIV
jgi:hypothetical protein